MDYRHHDALATSPACTCVGEDVSLEGLHLPGTRWRAALAALTEAPLRLHRFRHMHAEAVEDAIRAYDFRAHRRERT